MKEAIFARALRAYERSCKRSGHKFELPDVESSSWDNTSFVLRSVRNELVRYRINAAGVLYRDTTNDDISQFVTRLARRSHEEP